MRPPVNRAMRTLDRSFFKRVLPISAARILNNKDIEACRSQLMKSKDALELRKAPGLRPVLGPDSVPSGFKCLLLRRDVKQDGIVASESERDSKFLQTRHLGGKFLRDLSKTGEWT